MNTCTYGGLPRDNRFLLTPGALLCVPTRFYARDSGLLKFKIQAGLLGRPVNHTVRRLVAFTFHPFEPFAISVQRTNAEYVVNFHMRHVCA